MLRLLAASPNTPIGVLTHLVEYACTDGPLTYRGFHDKNIALRRALITNPNVPVEHVHRLLNLKRGDGRIQVQREPYDRPGLTGDVLLELLGNDVSATLLADALAYFPDPDGTLAAHAATGRWADSVMVRSQIVMSEHADRDLRERTALTLAHVEALNQKAARAIAKLAAERLAAAKSAQEFAPAWVDQSALQRPARRSRPA